MARDDDAGDITHAAMQATILARIEGMEGKFGQRFDGVESGLGRIQGWLGEVDKRVDDVRERTSRLEGQREGEDREADRHHDRPRAKPHWTSKRVASWAAIAAAAVAFLGGLSAAADRFEKLLTAVVHAATQK